MCALHCARISYTACAQLGHLSLHDTSRYRPVFSMLRLPSDMGRGRATAENMAGDSFYAMVADGAEPKMLVGPARGIV